MRRAAVQSASRCGAFCKWPPLRQTAPIGSAGGGDGDGEGVTRDQQLAATELSTPQVNRRACQPHATLVGVPRARVRPGRCMHVGRNRERLREIEGVCKGAAADCHWRPVHATGLLEESLAT
jgi:hypothetical protein